MTFPIDDWQFWSVTAATAGALWLLVKPFLGRESQPAGPCPSCPQSEGGRCASHEARERLVVLGGDR